MFWIDFKSFLINLSKKHSMEIFLLYSGSERDALLREFIVKKLLEWSKFSVGLHLGNLLFVLLELSPQLLYLVDLIVLHNRDITNLSKGTNCNFKHVYSIYRTKALWIYVFSFFLISQRNPWRHTSNLGRFCN